ncbi:MAG TPA: PqqD family protein [Thermoanaerobaculia bacterium]|jgi:hypothetical protein|nr:PqqD family protein [Thermoanaerobaculia bacterium]
MSPLRPSASTRFRRVAEEGILLNLDSMLYFHLDEVGTFAWERLEAGEPLDRIAEAIAETFDVDAATARRDLDPLVKTLVEAGLLVE